MSDINTAILERLERVVDSLQENSVKMGQLLAVHNEKLDKQDKVDEEDVDHIWRSHCNIFFIIGTRTKSYETVDRISIYQYDGD